MKNVLAGKYEYLLCKTITLGNGRLVSVTVNCGNWKILQRTKRPVLALGNGQAICPFSMVWGGLSRNVLSRYICAISKVRMIAAVLLGPHL